MKNRFACVGLVVVLAGCSSSSSSGGGTSDAAAGDASVDGGSCADRTAAAQSAAGAAMSAAEASLDCSVDTDCVFASVQTTCWLACTALTNRAGAATLDAALAHIDQTTCATFVADGCKPNPAPPCNAPLGPSCVGGKCVGEPPDGG